MSFDWESNARAIEIMEVQGVPIRGPMGSRGYRWYRGCEAGSAEGVAGSIRQLIAFKTPLTQRYRGGVYVIAEFEFA